MTSLFLLTEFNECCHGPWTEAPGWVSYRLEGTELSLQPSKEAVDWARNFDQFPVIRRIGGHYMVIPRGFAMSFDTLRSVLKHEKIEYVRGYSHGAALAALISEDRDIPATVFGCPHYALFIGLRFKNVVHVDSEPDIVIRVSPFYRRGPRVLTMKGNYPGPSQLGHGASEYRWRILEGDYHGNWC